MVGVDQEADLRVGSELAQGLADVVRERAVAGVHEQDAVRSDGGRQRAAGAFDAVEASLDRDYLELDLADAAQERAEAGQGADGGEGGIGVREENEWGFGLLVPEADEGGERGF